MGSGNLLDRLFHVLHHRSEAAESLLHTLCHFDAVEEFRVFVVGGLVRDILLNAELDADLPLDIDLAVDGDPSPLHAALATAAGVEPTIHDRFGTASAGLPDGTRVDVARTRNERYPSPGALPIVSSAPIEVDLSRRDFTVNAAALPLTGDSRGVLLDPHNALGDLERRLMRTLHRDSFRDDPTRLVRAARYSARIHGEIERRTMSDVRRDRHYLDALSPERFGDAWRLLLTEREPRLALSLARRLMIPQSRDARWIVPKSAVMCANGPEQFWAAIGLLSRDRAIVDWLPRAVGMRRQERNALAGGATLRRHRRRTAAVRQMSLVARTLERAPDPALQAAACLWTGPSGSAVVRYLERREEVRSPIAATRLSELGIQNGPAMGDWFRRIESAIWDGKLDPDDPESVARMEQQIRLSR